MRRAIRTSTSKAGQDGLNAYFERIKRTALLTAEQEVELSKRVQKGDASARDELIEANLRLVVKIAKGYLRPDVTLLDLIQEGNLGLLTAAGKFDYRKEVRFSTYASWWIKQSISRALSNKRRQIRLPHRKEDLLRKIQKAYTLLSQKLARKPSVEEVAEELGVPRGEVADMLTVSTATISLDSNINEDNGTLHDLCEDYSYAPEPAAMEQSLKEQTLRILDRLREREREILMYRFALHGGKKYTLKKLSDQMGISPETVRQIELRALKKLRDQASELREFVYG